MPLAPTTLTTKKKPGLPFPTSPYTGAASTAPSLTPMQTPQTPYAGAAPLPFGSAPPVAPIQTPTNVTQALSNTNDTLGQAKGSIAATQPFLDQYLKPNTAGTTPFRQALTNTKASETANAYDNAVSQARNRAVAAGFGSVSQPVTFGAETAIGNERTKAIADIPNKVNLEAQPVEFQAAQMQQNQAGIYNALANTQQGESSILAQQKAAADAQKMALVGGLANTGIQVAAPLIKSALAGAAPAAATTAATVAAPAALGFAAPAGLASFGAAGGGALAGTGALAAPSIAAPALAPGAAGATAGAGGMGATLGALATNPVTWAVAGAITAAIIWKKSQVHPTATTFVDTYQKPFGDHLGQIVNGFDQAYASGQLTKAQAQAIYDETAKLVREFEADTNAFSQKGGHENTVAHQAAATMAQNFGPNWENLLGKMQAEIAGLA